MTLKSWFKNYFDDLRYHGEVGIPTIHARLRFSRDGMIRFKGQTMPVLGSVATVETSGSISRTGGMLINRRHDDRVHWLIIESPTGIFQVGARSGPFTEKNVRKIAAHINVANKKAGTR